MADGDWEAVSVDQAEPSLASWLESKGLGKFTEKIVEATDAESVDDLKLIDGTMVETVIQEAGLKLVSAQKLRLALAELRGEGAPAASAPVPNSQAVPAAAEATPPASGAAPASPPQEALATELQECVAICIDRSGSMRTPFAETTVNVVQGAVAQRTRMEAVKAMFYAFRDRVDAVGHGAHQMGLIQFDDHIERMLDLTPRLDRFEAIVDDMSVRGRTAIYSSIIEAVAMLEGQFHAESKVDLRVLVLTDGQSNDGAGPSEALERVNRIGAVVDAIIVGHQPDSNLRRIVNATGGECYQINDLGEGFELLESEGVVSLRARRGGIEKPAFVLRSAVDFDSIAEKAMTKGSAVKCTPTLTPDLSSKAVVDVAKLSASVPSQSSSGSQKRILKELQQVSSGAAGVWLHSGEGVRIFPAPDAIDFWRVLIEGPPGSPFEGGVFALHVQLPSDYPFKAPKITFETPVYHCNVSDSGKICLDILEGSWAPSLSVPKCLEAVRTMLKDPDTDNALRQWIAELTLAQKQSQGADTRYYDKACENTKKDASKSVEEWKQEWGC